MDNLIQHYTYFEFCWSFLKKEGNSFHATLFTTTTLPRHEFNPVPLGKLYQARQKLQWRIQQCSITSKLICMGSGIEHRVSLYLLVIINSNLIKNNHCAELYCPQTLNFCVFPTLLAYTIFLRTSWLPLALIQEDNLILCSIFDARTNFFKIHVLET
jgi:hypothetical protein